MIKYIGVKSEIMITRSNTKRLRISENKNGYLNFAFNVNENAMSTTNHMKISLAVNSFDHATGRCD